MPSPKPKGYAPRKEKFFDHVQVLARHCTYHPVRDYLRGLTWDGVPRVQKFLASYIGGAVSRIMRPGAQLDYMLVLEGPQGRLKSSAIRALGSPWFTDALRLGADAKATIEQTAGYWLIEVAELAGMDRRDIEAVKAQITTREDRARPAYGRLAVTVPRQFVMIGTTNNSTYLKDQTGNRQFLPVTVGDINLEAVRRDRDQLWAEALKLVNASELPVLPKDMIAAAASAQEARLVVDAISERLRELLGDVPGGRIAKEEIWRALGLADAGRRSQSAMNSAHGAMRKMGWDASRQRRPGAGALTHCFEKAVRGIELTWFSFIDGAFAPSNKNEVSRR